MKVRLRALQEQMAQSRERDAAITRDLDRLGLQLEAEGGDESSRQGHQVSRGKKWKEMSADQRTSLRRGRNSKGLCVRHVAMPAGSAAGFDQ
jgi:hypothetical protein